MDEIRTRKLNDHIQDIKHSMRKVGIGLVEIGYHLKEIHDNGLEQEKGYIDIWNLAKEEFGFEKSATNRMMRIYEEYGVCDEFGIPKLRGEYAEFNKGQLIEMLNIPEEIREEIPVSATVKDIRETKAEFKTEETPKLNSWDTDLDDKKRAILSLFEKPAYAAKFEEVFKNCNIDGLSTKEAEYRQMMAVTGNGYATAKAAGYIIFMKEDEITLMKGSYKEKISYSNMEDILMLEMRTDEFESAKECWENFYGKPYPAEPVKTTAVIKDEPVQKEKPKEKTTPAKKKTTEADKKTDATSQQEELEGQMDLSEVAEQEYIGERTVEAEIVDKMCECCEGGGYKTPDGNITMFRKIMRIYDAGGQVILDAEVNYCPICGKKVAG